MTVCDRSLVIECGGDDIASLVETVFGDLLDVPGASADSPARYVIDAGADGAFRTVDFGRRTIDFPDAESLLFNLDKSITIAVQYLRSDLYFVHGAAVALNDRAVVLSAPAGTGKSTLALALLNRGRGRIQYLSDELAPIDVPTLTVHPYPRRLCLKSWPPVSCRPSVDVFGTGSRFHVAAAALADSPRGEPVPLGAAFFVRRTGGGPGCHPLSPGAAAARFVANALNSAAHPAAGLDVALALSRAVPCFDLEISDLESACSAIEAALVENGG